MGGGHYNDKVPVVSNIGPTSEGVHTINNAMALCSLRSKDRFDRARGIDGRLMKGLDMSPKSPLARYIDRRDYRESSHHSQHCDN